MYTHGTSTFRLNDEQSTAATFGLPLAHSRSERETLQPLLVLAGAGTGKTTTVAYRVANIIKSGVAPQRILLMTFSRRAAKEMTMRALRVVAQDSDGSEAVASLPWAGTFHSIAHRLLRHYAAQIGLAPDFSILDRGDAADLMDVCRQELDLHGQKIRFPRKETCLDIYSRCTNRQQALKKVIETEFPFCNDWQDELQNLFRHFVKLKQDNAALDYDDLLLYWHFMMQDKEIANDVSRRFDHVLVDEYQDTNVLQSHILKALKPDGAGVTVVGDDAQSIYSFRAATVENIWGFAEQYSPAACVVKLERNYRSHQPILNFANELLRTEKMPYSRNLLSTRTTGDKPFYVTVEDAVSQARYICEQILTNREAGLDLQDQAVLFRNSHHSDVLEIELGRRNIPYVKYGGLKFLESLHIKDVMCLLRWSVNPKDQLAAFRTIQLLPGVGPALARKAWNFHCLQHHDFSVLEQLSLGPAKQAEWVKLCDVMCTIAQSETSLFSRMEQILTWYRPHFEHRFADSVVRWGDLEQLLQIATSYATAENFLADLILDPPQATGDQAGPPLIDEDFLILSTVHSAKGQEWSSVFVLNVVDGSFPSEFAAGDDQLIAEEKRLFYVAATRAKDQLHLMSPLRFYVPQQRKYADRHVYGAQSRFMTAQVLEHCDRRFYGVSQTESGLAATTSPLDLPSRIGALWQ